LLLSAREIADSIGLSEAGARNVACRSIGQESLNIVRSSRSSSSLDKLTELIDWRPIAALLEPLYPASKGEPAWPPLAMFKALLLAVWYDLSDVKLAEALDDRASFRRFCGFSSNEATPERTAFVRFRRALIAHGLDRHLFETITAELKARAITVKTGTLVDATIIASASETDAD
jgi:IS5 family transposase